MTQLNLSQQNNGSLPQHTPDALISQAIEKGLGVEQLAQLMDLQDRWEAKQARKKFYDAQAIFQAELPRLEKSKKVAFDHKDGGGKTEYWYAPLSDIVDQIKKPLSSVGLSYRWEIQEKAQELTVTCVVTHSAGHSERTTMSGQADNSGKKNSIQQRGSTITYLQRYTLIGALGIASADMDNDGKGSASGKTEKKLMKPDQKQYASIMKSVVAGTKKVEDLVNFYEFTADQLNALEVAAKNASQS